MKAASAAASVAADVVAVAAKRVAEEALRTTPGGNAAAQTLESAAEFARVREAAFPSTAGIRAGVRQPRTPAAKLAAGLKTERAADSTAAERILQRQSAAQM